MVDQTFEDSLQPHQTRFFVRHKGERLVRYLDSEYAYLRGYGWITAPKQSKLESILEDCGRDDQDALSVRIKNPEVSGWRECTEDEARKYAQALSNREAFDEKALGRWSRLKAYFETHGLRLARQPVPYGPAPRLLVRKLQEEAQDNRLPDLPSDLDSSAFADWTEWARDGYKQEEARIDGIQQRATFFLGATGLTTTAVLVNGGLLYGANPLQPPAMRFAVGILLMFATLALAAAGYAALAATMMTFDRARPNSVWRIERRMELDGNDAPRDLLAATLLAAQRAEAIGDWKIRQLKFARLWFALAVLFLALASLLVLLAVLP